MEVELYFSDYFEINPEVIENHGAFNVSLLSDLPLFIDPFLLFTSKKKEYQGLHDSIIKYLAYLRDNAIKHPEIDVHALKYLYCFPEVKQNWFGFSFKENGGSGLGLDFAKALHSNLYAIFNDFGKEKITKGSHLEKLCLIKDGVGKDNISDFTTNLIKEYLLEYTQDFTLKNLPEEKRKEFPVEKVRFNYDKEVWEGGRFILPSFNGQYVILTPIDMLTRDEIWINKQDLSNSFDYIHATMEDGALRDRLNNYILKSLKEDSKSKEREAAKYQAFAEIPELIDFYIKYKEDNGEYAQSNSLKKIDDSKALYNEQFGTIVKSLVDKGFYSTPENSEEDTRNRILFFKDVIENQDGYKKLYLNGVAVEKEYDIQILFKFVWFNTKFDINREPNNGRGPVDFKVSKGAKDKTLVEFKLAKNTHLKKNLEKQLEIYKDANGTDKGFYVIFYFSEEQQSRVKRILKELELEQSKYIVLVDARADNKQSASTV